MLITLLQFQMQCKIKRIQRYPFPISYDSHPLSLSYTVLASPQTCNLLHIFAYGYRFFNSTIVLIVNTNDVSYQSQVLYVPYNIYKLADGKPILIEQHPLSLSTDFLPLLPTADKLFLYANPSECELVQRLLSRESFVVNPGYCYISGEWLECMFKESMSWKAIALVKLMHKQKGYLKVYLEVRDAEGRQGREQRVCRRGETKIEVVKEKLHPLCQYRVREIPLLYREIIGKYYSIEVPCVENCIVLLQCKEDVGVEMVLEIIAEENKIQFQIINCKEYVTSKSFYEKIRNICSFQSSIILVQNINWLQKINKIQQSNSVDFKDILKQVQSNFKQAIEQIQRKYILVLTTSTVISRDIFTSVVLSKTLTLSQEAQKQILTMILTQIDPDYEQAINLVQQLKGKIAWCKFERILNKKWHTLKTQSLSSIIKQFIPQTQNVISVSWDDVGGLQTAKQQIIQTILLPRHHPQIFDSLIRPRTGLLFYGPPGTGKTLLGKCIAKQCSMGFMSVKGPQLLNMYVGESEKNVRQLFERAASISPCIVFMDELDALVPKRGNSGDSNQVMDRIVAELMTQMDLAGSNGVFVIGATNRPDLLDPSILRAGRFDKQIYLGICSDKQSQVKILRAQTRSVRMEEGFSFERVVAAIDQQYTGADFYALTSKATQKGIDRCIEVYESQGKVQQIVLRESDFVNSIPLVKPSVTKEDLKRYEQLKEIYY